MRVSFARETITRLEYTLIDDRGTEVVNLDADPTRLDITRCWLEPIETTEVIDGRIAVLSGYTGTAPAGTVLRSNHHVEYRGIEYELAGDAIDVPSPTGALDEVKFSIRRWTHGR